MFCIALCLNCELDIYADEIVANVPAVVVWRHQKNSVVQLSIREPKFRANRAFFADITTASTAIEHPYYAFNVVEYVGFERADPKSNRVKILFKLHYDDNGRVRQRLEARLTAVVDEKLNLGPSDSLVFKLRGAADNIATRHFAEGNDSRSRTAARRIPELMFTPQTFQSIPRPTMPWRMSAQPRTKALGNAAWLALATHVQSDWDMYVRARERFDRQYRDQLTQLIN